MKCSSTLVLARSRVLAGPPRLLAADRLTDRDVKALADRIDQGRNTFRTHSTAKLKHDIFRGPGGEVDVERFLHDFKDNVDKLKDRLKGRLRGQRRGRDGAAPGIGD